MIMKTDSSSYVDQSILPPRILLCPSGFKESLDPDSTARCIETGIARVTPDAIIHKTPLVDGGEGFCKALVEATGGELRYLEVTGPVGEPVSSFFGLLGGDHKGTAVVEMAVAAGLRLVPKNRRDPTLTTTFGVGELVKAALEADAKRILVGCGDSGTCDGGVGMAQALGVRFLDSMGLELPRVVGARGLLKVSAMDITNIHPQLATTSIEAACNWHNVLCGPKGVAKVFGPQKGASPQDVEMMSTAMDRWSSIVSNHLQRDVSFLPGSGASGGLGAGLVLIGAKLRPRYDLIMKFFNIDSLLAECDLVITAEGAIDYQTPHGKVPAEVAQRAKLRGLPVIVLAGSIGPGASCNYDAGIDAFTSIVPHPMSLEEAMNDAEALLTNSAESAMRILMIGRHMATVVSQRQSIEVQIAKRPSFHLKTEYDPVVATHVVTT